MNIRPLGDRLLVERLEEDTKTAGGIIIPDTAKEKPQKAKVLAVGEGARDESGKRIPMDVKVGDTVLFTKWGGSEIKVEGKEFLVLKESDVIGIIEETASKKKAA
ncbi:MAG: co-chaperone GroES [Alphaproteobacteria bacterium]|nr:co-chaperone GroES [Alphaproteobacteria bacterium]